MAFQVQKTDGNSTVWADPATPSTTVRCKQTAGRKGLGGNVVDNHITEIIINDLNDVTIGDDTVPDTLSIRVRISGSVHSHTRARALVGLLTNTLNSWDDENYVIGFTPSTVPAFPVSP
jgi:hypothetical protein